jgi:uncharacterized membrane protein YcfT
MDAGRGLAIILVVLLHACGWLQLAGAESSGWWRVNEVLSGLRMPLFFAISGMLGARWVGAPWASLLPRKVAFLGWVYLVWQPVDLLASAAADEVTGARESALHWVVALAATVVRPRSELWFLWALAVYFVLARLTSGVPLRWQLVVAGAVSAVALSTRIADGTLGWNGPPKFYLFFLVGAYGRAWMLSLAGRLRGAAAASLGIIAVWAAAAVAGHLLDLERFVGPGLVIRSLGLLAGIAVAGLLARSRWLRYLGARTLPIYLAHTPLIILVAWGVHTVRDSRWMQEATPVLPVAVTVVTIGAALLLHAGLRATPGWVLYAPPARVVALVAALSGSRRGGTGDLTVSPGR